MGSPVGVRVWLQTPLTWGVRVRVRVGVRVRVRVRVRV